ncbi:hypothetical protein PIB30_042271 [Stylosanthes scabra]|uniref:GATA transcription factor n=1 Tax=Stylosanthes scabra TaxID=79078 RepID=A0ABU6TFW6_9FABA|nr:hypothetical protein [Stylosanthes scabra]
MEAQELFQNNLCQQFPSDNSNNAPNSDHFIVEEFFDFSNNDDADADDAPFISDTTTFDSLTGNSIDSSSTAAVLDSANSSASHPNILNTNDTPFSNDLPVPVPYDDLVELEWLSNFTEESFSSEEDIQKMQLISGIKAQNDVISEAHEFIRSEQPNRIINPVLNPEVSVPAKARSKRTRGPPCNWTSRLLAVSSISSAQSEPVIATPKKHTARKKENRDGGEGRKCLHCATEKTPQWRTGPMGPKTLCNACGVRYKSGRLVPEYRPAASPTFVLTKHSNSHRKVMELRRQKEMMMQTQQQEQQQQLLHHHRQRMMFDVSHNSDDYFIHQHMGPDFGHLM